MEHASCNVLYVDRNVREDRYLNISRGDTAADVGSEPGHIAENARLLLAVFGEGLLTHPGLLPRQIGD